MSLWKIAWRSIQQRAISSGLTAFSMALGVALVVAVLVILGVIDESFRRTAQGFDLIVGAKGGPRDLVLSTVYHIDRPPETVSMGVCDRLNTSTRYRSVVKVAVPLCMGDSYKGAYRVIGTTTAMFDRLQWFDGDELRNYEWAEGENFAENKPFEAVVGAVVARKTGLKVGENFKPVHGTDSTPGHETGHEHGNFTVAGVLKPTGTAVNRAIFVNIEGFYDVHHEAEKGEDHDEAAPEGRQGQRGTPVSLNPGVDAATKKGLPKIISQDPDLNVQAVDPTFEVTKLLEGIVGNLRLVLLVLAVLIVIVAGIGVMVSIYNSMSDRRHEIAVIRALGAKRRTVMLIVLLESILLALGGGVIGLIFGHGLTWALSAPSRTKPAWPSMPVAVSTQ